MADQRLKDSDLATLSSRLSDKWGQINGYVNKLNDEIDKLEGQWQGVGAGAFNTAQHSINTRMRNLNQILAQFQEGIEATRKLSINNEDDVAAAFRGADVVDSDYGVGASGQPTSALDKL